MDLPLSRGRFQDRDYRRAGTYFITVATYKREQILSQIVDGHVCLTGIGMAVHKTWMNSLLIRPDMHLYMADLVVMPDHFHGLIDIGENLYNTGDYYSIQTNQFGVQSKNLGSVVRGIKASVTVIARKLGCHGKIWHPRYFERQLFSAESIWIAKNYIR